MVSVTQSSSSQEPQEDRMGDFEDKKREPDLPEKAPPKFEEEVTPKRST